MNKYVSYIVLLMLLPWPVKALQDQDTYPLISEIMTATSDSTSAEYIELYNPSDDLFSLENHYIQYKSATGASWINKFEFEPEHSIEPRGYFLLTTKEFSDDQHLSQFNSGLAKGAGHIRLVRIEIRQELDALSGEVDEVEEIFVIDLLGYGSSADSPEQLPAGAPDSNYSLKRIVDEDGRYIDSNDNSADFIISTSPHPQHTLPPEHDHDDEETNDQENSDPQLEDSLKIYPKLEISELYIDPSSPQTDAEHEFVELYNFNAAPINLKGYTIQTGSSLQYSYTFESDTFISAKSFKAFTAKETSLVLANSGGKAQVIDPNFEVAAQLVGYTQAPVGQSWSLFDDGFEWTKIMTPGVENQRTPIEPEVKSATTRTSNSIASKIYPTILVTEALPDPAKPALDKTDEFVELYNPNNFPVVLTGYKLKTGKSLSTNQTLSDTIIQPKQYVALFSADYRMTLGNSGGQIVLLDPNGNQVSRSEVYGEAPEGAAWSYVDGVWAWTAKPTPAAKNELVLVVDSMTSGVASKSIGANNSLSPDILQTLAQPAAIPVRPTDYKLIGGAVAFAVLYGIYEYRFELLHRIDQSRSYLRARLKARS